MPRATHTAVSCRLRLAHPGPALALQPRPASVVWPMAQRIIGKLVLPIPQVRCSPIADPTGRSPSVCRQMRSQSHPRLTTPQTEHQCHARLGRQHTRHQLRVLYCADNYSLHHLEEHEHRPYRSGHWSDQKQSILLAGPRQEHDRHHAVIEHVLEVHHRAVGNEE